MASVPLLLLYVPLTCNLTLLVPSFHVLLSSTFPPSAVWLGIGCVCVALSGQGTLLDGKLKPTCAVTAVGLVREGEGEGEGGEKGEGVGEGEGEREGVGEGNGEGNVRIERGIDVDTG